MNKKIVILIVIVECILAILVIGVIGKAIETYFNDVHAEEIYFTTADGEVLTQGMKYIEKENKVEAIESERIVIEVNRWDRGYQLHWLVLSEKTTDKSVTFIAKSQNPDIEVSVNETGFVYFEGETNATIIISTTNGKTATVLLTTGQGEQSGDVDLGD